MSKKLIEVDAQAFDDLMYWLDRCSEKGHLENCADLVDPWAIFDANGWRVVESTQPAAAHGDEAVRKDAERYRWLILNAEEIYVNPATGFGGNLSVDWIAARLHGEYEKSKATVDAEIDAMRAQGDGEVQ